MKKIVVFISLIIIAIFIVIVAISLIPASSKKDAGDYSSTSLPSGTGSNSGTDVPGSSTITEDTNIFDTTIPSFTSTVLPPSSATRVEFVANLEEIVHKFEYDGKVVATVNIKSPTIISNKELLSLPIINQHLKDSTDMLIDNYKAAANQFIEDYDPKYSEIYNCNIVSEIHYTSKVLSICMSTISAYSRGGTEYSMTCFNYSIATGELLSIDDVVPDKNALIEAIIQICESKTNIDFSAGYKNYITTKICNEWYIGKEGPVMVYKPYEIATGSAGMIEIIVPEYLFSF